MHGPGLRVLVLGVEGDEQRQAGADGLGHVPHRPHRDQPLAEQHFQGEAPGPEHGVQVGLGLGGGEVPGRLTGGGQQHPGVAGADLFRHGVAVVLPQPGARPEKVLQHAGQLPAVAALLQGQKLAQPGRGLGGAQHLAFGHGGEPVDQRPVVVLRQKPGRGAVVF